MPDGTVPITQLYREDIVFSALPMFHVSRIRTVHPIHSFLGFNLRLRAHLEFRVPSHWYLVVLQYFQHSLASRRLLSCVIVQRTD